MNVEGHNENLRKDLSVLTNAKNKVNLPVVSIIMFIIIYFIILIVGLMHLTVCPVKKTIYFALLGATGLVSKGVLPLINYKLNKKVITVIMYLLIFVQFVLLIVGSIWVYSIHNVYNTHCDERTHDMAFWLLNFNWIIIFLTLVIIIISCIKNKHTN